MKMKRIYVGLVGKAGSGKDEFCDRMALNSGSHVVSYRKAFADALKKTCAVMYGVNEEVFHDREKKEVVDARLGVTPRELLQKFGTDIVRQLDPDHWVKRLEVEVENTIPEASVTFGFTHQLVVIPDVRFQNEIDWVKENGGVVINIVRENPDVGEMDKSHLSETALNDVVDYDDVIENNGTLENLSEQAVIILNKYGLS